MIVEIFSLLFSGFDIKVDIVVAIMITQFV